ncbi:MAG: ATP-binding protein [Deltaproteobacteria bacterium]|nr:ATP-binding protein [Deltaproteobacteria bacterium]
MIITIASGKGGTGKTTVATNLAVSLADKVQLLDCDVEEPNVHIFLRTEPVSKEIVRTMIPDVDSSLCTHCGECEKICQFSAIALIGETIMTFPEMCHSCKGCLMVCPEGAIRESSRELGEILIDNAEGVELVYGRLRVGEAMSPPLIEKVKDHINKEMITIIDAPPGTSCPVIAALKSSDFVLLVTEPTPFGLNDLTLAVEAVRTMELPFGIVINRCDSGNDGVLQYAKKENIQVIMEIPDRREIAENYSKGVLMVNARPEMKELFKALYSKIENRTRN